MKASSSEKGFSSKVALAPHWIVLVRLLLELVKTIDSGPFAPFWLLTGATYVCSNQEGSFVRANFRVVGPA